MIGLHSKFVLSIKIASIRNRKSHLKTFQKHIKVVLEGSSVMKDYLRFFLVTHSDTDDSGSSFLSTAPLQRTIDPRVTEQQTNVETQYTARSNPQSDPTQ